MSNSAAEIEEKRLLLAEMEQNRYKYFVPNGAQEEYIRAVGEMTGTRIFLFSSANAVGKTTAVVNILAHLIWGKDSKNEFFDFSMYKSFPYEKRAWYVSEHTSLKETIGPAIEEWFPAGRYQLIKRDGYPVQLRADTGFVIDFKRYDQDPEKFESATLGVIVLDEPAPESIYKACISRLRMGGIILMPMTPLFKAAYVKDRILNGNEYAYVQFADVEENCREHGKRGVLEHAQIEFMAAQMDPEEREARLHGKFMFLAGLVFKEFSRDVHVISVDRMKDLWPESMYGKFTEWPKVQIIDPHDRRPDAVAWAALAPDGSWIIYDEYPDRDFYSIKYRNDDIKQTLYKCFLKDRGETEKEWKALWPGGVMKIYRRLMDRRKGAQNVSDLNQDLRDVYQNRAAEIGHPVTIELSYNDHNKLDHKLIHEALHYERDKDGNLIVRPKLYVMRDCVNTIYCFEHYNWDDWTGKTSDRRGLKEQVQDKYKDYIDLIRYLLGEGIEFERVAMSKGEDDVDRYFIDQQEEFEEADWLTI